MHALRGSHTVIRIAVEGDVDELVRIRETPEVLARWRGSDIAAELRESIADSDLEFLVIENLSGRIAGAIQWAANDDPDYPHVSIDLFLGPEFHGQGLGSDAVCTLCRYLVNEHAVHRFVIDPAADNVAAIRCYEKAGFRAVGIMRDYERNADGSLHDGLLMDMLAHEILPIEHG
jgi:aminoglycoside 6'-N-acetyltransferase